jgi:dsDNA-specific endonuclease/ATPase MutS2
MADNNIEVALTEIKEQLDNEKKVAEILANSADEIVKSQTEKFEAFAKNIDGLSEKVDSLVAKLEALNIPSVEDIEKSINAKVESAKEEIDTKVEEIKKSVADQEEKVETIEKSVEANLNEPVQKSVKVLNPVEEVKEVAVEAPVSTDDLINKALAELATVSTVERARELNKAIVQLNSGVNPASIKL